MLSDLFTLPVRQDSPLAWLNHPLCLAAMAGLMAASVALSAALANRGERYWNESDGTQGNRGSSIVAFSRASFRRWMSSPAVFSCSPMRTHASPALRFS